MTDASLSARRGPPSFRGRLGRRGARGRVLSRMAGLLREEAERFALVEALHSGKRLREAQGDIGGAIRAFEYDAGAADKPEGEPAARARLRWA